MSKELFSCTPEDNIAEAEKVMRANQIHRLLVLDANRHPVRPAFSERYSREGAHEAEMKTARQISDAEISGLLASVCAPRHRVIEAEAA